MEPNEPAATPHVAVAPVSTVEALGGELDTILGPLGLGPAWDWSRLPPSADRYALGRRVARGGMGDLHAGTDRVLGRAVAVKVVRAEHLADPSALLRFLQEARIHGQLHHRGARRSSTPTRRASSTGT